MKCLRCFCIKNPAPPLRRYLPPETVKVGMPSPHRSPLSSETKHQPSNIPKQLPRGVSPCHPGCLGCAFPFYNQYRVDVLILPAPGAGCLIYEVFNGVLHKQEDLARLQVAMRAWCHSAVRCASLRIQCQRVRERHVRRRLSPRPSPTNSRRCCTRIHSAACTLVSPWMTRITPRLSPPAPLPLPPFSLPHPPGAPCRASPPCPSYFDTEIVRIGLFLSELALKDVDEKVQFFSHLQNLSSTVPPQFSKHKLIPELLKIMVRLSFCPSQNCDI